MPGCLPVFEWCHDIHIYSHSHNMKKHDICFCSPLVCQHGTTSASNQQAVAGGLPKDDKNTLQQTAAGTMSICINKAVASDHSLHQLAYPTGRGNCCELEGDVWLSGAHPVSGHWRGRLRRCSCHWLCQPQPHHGALCLLCGQPRSLCCHLMEGQGQGCHSKLLLLVN